MTLPGDWLSTLLWLIFLWLLIWVGPKLMLQQVIWNLEKEVTEMEALAKRAENLLIRILPKKTRERRIELTRFLDFFSISPVDLDPYGIVRKMDHIIRNSEARLRAFVRRMYFNLSFARENDFKSAIAGAITARQIAKLVRHYLELTKKYKNLQIALLIQMQLPMIKKLLEANVKATEAFLKEIPIGDSIGPLIAAKLMKGKKKIYREEEFVVGETVIGGKRVFVAKALGPGATPGYPGKFLLKFLKKKKIDRIITIDAAIKMEGEKTGSVAEGVGVVCGAGVERFEIEEVATRHGISLDAMVIKQSNEEAFMPMKREILESTEEAISRLESLVRLYEKGENILVIGVGNTCGVGNSPKEAEEAEKKLRKMYRSAERAKREKRKKLF